MPGFSAACLPDTPLTRASYRAFPTASGTWPLNYLPCPAKPGPADGRRFWQDATTATKSTVAVAEADPDGPPPEAGGDDDEADDDWGPIRLGTLPPAEAFPLDVLPGPARDLAEAVARSIRCPVDFPAVAALATASGLIGRSASLLVKPGYFATASLYAALVGGPSSGKSPALRAALAPVWRLAEILFDEARAARALWNEAPEDERGEEPAVRRIVTTDPTTEALGPILASNPRGLIVAPDEMTKWVMSMDQYKGGKGGDRPFYLSAWVGEPIYIDRAKNMKEPIVVPHPFLNIVGGMTPDMLTALSEGRGRDDGFMARLLFTFPNRVANRRYSEEGVPDSTAARLGRAAKAGPSGNGRCATWKAMPPPTSSR